MLNEFVTMKMLPFSAEIQYKEDADSGANENCYSGYSDGNDCCL